MSDNPPANAQQVPEAELPVTVTLDIALQPQLSLSELRRLAAIAASEGLNMKSLMVRQLKLLANGAGIGVSIVPHMMVKHQETPGCVSLPFAGPVPERELNFVHNPLRFQNKAAAAFHREAAALLSGEDSSTGDDVKN